MRRARCDGFTLIEVLVVLGIIGILVALMLTAITQAKARSQRAQCAHNVRQLGVALAGFVADNHAYPLWVNPYPDTGPYAEHSSSWVAALQHSELARSSRLPKGSAYLHQGVWQCPAAHPPPDLPPHQGYVSYGYNGFGMSPMSAETDTSGLGLGGQFVWTSSRLPAPPVAESEVASPSEMMAIGDGFAGGDGVVRDGGLGLHRTHGLKDYLGSTRRSHLRHQDRANVVFCDGHVEVSTLELLFEDRSDAALVRWNRDHQPHRDRL